MSALVALLATIDNAAMLPHFPFPHCEVGSAAMEICLYGDEALRPTTVRTALQPVSHVRLRKAHLGLCKLSNPATNLPE